MKKNKFGKAIITFFFIFLMMISLFTLIAVSVDVGRKYPWAVVGAFGVSAIVAFLEKN